MISPLVSICIPAYEQPALFEKALRSICEQDYTNIEVIVSDDTPGNAVKIIADKYSAELTLKYHHNIPALGTPANWNNALDLAIGDVLMLLHHDDRLAFSYSISHSIALLNKHDKASVLFGRSMAIDKLVPANQPFDAAFFTPFYQQPIQLLYNNVVGPPSNVMMRKSVKERYGLSYKWLVDLEFYLRLLLAGNRFVYLDERLVEVGIHEGQMTNVVQRNADIMVRENVLFAHTYPQLIAKNIKAFDHIWRLLRNQHIRSVNDLYKVGLTEKHVPAIVKNMLKSQAIVPAGLLKHGPLSKLLMSCIYLLNR